MSNDARHHGQFCGGITSHQGTNSPSGERGVVQQLSTCQRDITRAQCHGCTDLHPQVHGKPRASRRQLSQPQATRLVNGRGLRRGNEEAVLISVDIPLTQGQQRLRFQPFGVEGECVNASTSASAVDQSGGFTTESGGCSQKTMGTWMAKKAKYSKSRLRANIDLCWGASIEHAEAGKS